MSAIRYAAVVAASVPFLIPTGCGSMSEALDRSITVSRPETVYAYQRVGMDPVGCRGELCRRANLEDAERELARGLGAACYEVVGSEEIARYGQHYAGRQASAGMRFSIFGMETFGLEVHEMERDLAGVVVDELGLQGIVQVSFDIGRPDSITEFRTSVIDVKLIDAQGRHTVWHGRHQASIMDDEDVDQALRMSALQMGQALARRVNICEPPYVAVEAPADDSFRVVEQQLELPERIHFELGSHRLSPRSHGVLNQLAAYLEGSPDIRHLRIEGHTDDIGDDAANQALSERRAQSVRDYLVSQGIAAERLSAVGYGVTRPLVPNDSPANRATNRRVDLVIVP